MVGRLEYFTLPLRDPVASMALTTFIDSSSAIAPKTTCRPLSHGVTTVVMKNCEPLLDSQETSVIKSKDISQSRLFFTKSWVRFLTPRGFRLRVRAGVGHGQKTRPIVCQFEVFVSELLTIDGFATSALCIIVNIYPLLRMRI